jgi:ABC-type sugar transport system permease subunit
MDFGRKLNGVFPTRESRRPLHGALLLLAAIFILLGYLVAFTCHEHGCSAKHPAQNHFPWTWEPAVNSPNARSAHVVIGLIAVIAVALQTAAGLYKAVQLEKTRERVLAWHGVVGPLIWLCGITCVALAAYFEYMEKDVTGKTAWTLQQMILILVALVVLVSLVTVHLRCGTKRHVVSDCGVCSGAISFFCTRPCIIHWHIHLNTYLTHPYNFISLSGHRALPAERRGGRGGGGQQLLRESIALSKRIKKKLV